MLSRITGRLSVFVRIAANAALRPLSRFSRRDPLRWVFGHSRGMFNGNSRALYLWLTLHRHDVDFTWIGADDATRQAMMRNSLPSYSRWSMRGIMAVLKAKVFVYTQNADSINLPLSGGAFLLNLWHGIGLKGIKYGYNGGDAKVKGFYGGSFINRMRNLAHSLDPDAVATTSDFTQKHFAAQFRLPPERCPIVGYPRLDYAFDSQLKQLSDRLDRGAGFQFNAGGFDRAFIYMPTHRDTGRPFLADAFPDLARLQSFLEEQNACLYLKLHGHTKDTPPPAGANILHWPSGIDVNPYLHQFDCLITDYSSVLYDYLLVRAEGAILYLFDYEQYSKADRTLLYPFFENVAGVEARTFDELLDALATGAKPSPAQAAQLEAVRDRFWGDSATPSSPAVIEYVLGRLEG